uniref:WSC domain-containing protein n=1 Tax=Macrostomum lignano TaxID=282301 RepID=A0A1I8IV52_9PLAT
LRAAAGPAPQRERQRPAAAATRTVAGHRRDSAGLIGLEPDRDFVGLQAVAQLAHADQAARHELQSPAVKFAAASHQADFVWGVLRGSGRFGVFCGVQEDLGVASREVGIRFSELNSMAAVDAGTAVGGLLLHLRHVLLLVAIKDLPDISAVAVALAVLLLDSLQQARVAPVCTAADQAVRRVLLALVAFGAVRFVNLRHKLLNWLADSSNAASFSAPPPLRGRAQCFEHKPPVSPACSQTPSGNAVVADSSRRDRDPRQFVASFLDYTTAHGLGRFAHQSSLLGRMIWLTFLLGTYSGFVYHLYTLFGRFLTAPVLTTMTMSTLSYEFPDVYICPAQAVTLSRAIEQMPIGLINWRENDRTVPIDFKIHFYEFDLESRNYAAQNKPAQALMNVLQSAESSLMAELQFPKSSRVECRTTLSGEEYSGNASVAVVYDRTKMRVTASNISGVLPPFRTYRQCMQWNDAAQRLRSVNTSLTHSLADRLLALNFSDSESRCRSPPGLPLSEFFPHRESDCFRKLYSALFDIPTEPGITGPMLRLVGCFEANFTDHEFNYTCDTEGIVTHETCAHCCASLDFSHIALQVDSCLCGASPPSSGNDSGVCSSRCASNDQQHCGSASAITVLQIGDTEPRPLQVGNFSNLTVFSHGPYCFFTDERDRLGAAFCDVPFCPMSGAYDCIVSSENKTLERLTRARYTGRKNYTITGKPCVPWSKLEKIQEDTYIRMGYNYHKQFGFHIQTPDFNPNSSDNFCRSAQIVIDHGSYFSSHEASRFAQEMSDVPGCIPDIMGWGGLFDADFEPCEIPLCYAAVPSVTGAVRDSVGSHLLARQFGSDLNAGLAECSFAGQKCTKDDFVNVAHPQLGMCHKFLKQRFTANMTSTQLAESQLSIKYFTDSTDSKGQTVSNINKLTRVVRDSHGSDATQVAFKVSLRRSLSVSVSHAISELGCSTANPQAVIVPDSSFPWASKGIDVATAQRMDVQLRFDKYSRLSTTSRPCLETTEPITYRLPSWKSAPFNENPDDSFDLNAVAMVTDWWLKVAAMEVQLRKQKQGALSSLSEFDLEFKLTDRDDCINTHVVKKFIAECHCLPSFLPIPVEYFSNYTYCFAFQAAGNVSMETDMCYRKQKSKVLEYQFAAVRLCQSPCRTAEYSVRHITYPWPNLNGLQSFSFLKALATAFGYGSNPSGLRGLNSIYSIYLRSLRDSAIPVSNRSATEILSFQNELTVLQNRLAQLTVQAWTSFGQEILEEEAYPAKNLVADIGGDNEQILYSKAALESRQGKLPHRHQTLDHCCSQTEVAPEDPWLAALSLRIPMGFFEATSSHYPRTNFFLCLPERHMPEPSSLAPAAKKTETIRWRPELSFYYRFVP